MRPHLHQAPIRPQISTMPRPKTEAAAYLDIYKLVTERKRLELELEALDQRRDRILQRLDLLNQQTAALEAAAHQTRNQATVTQLESTVSTTIPLDGCAFTTIELEY